MVRQAKLLLPLIIL